ncbi:histidine phosphatase family protein [Paenibacillus alba]|uniref:Histidine phosphatase family protein n=1 Tax=Paenibacillus alba TaxID=1197127 RepID=A0ABU6FW06_9BACL|nr:histidine phosphatase family protein [Paenibacillus alba]MEC0226073.1 histidine phosphatase family protein [Paenibacillus alba]
MNTFVYFVRHAESLYIEGMERTRGLSEKGRLDSLQVGEFLKKENIDVFCSSTYERAIQTIQAAAGEKEILLFEDLKERELGEISEWTFKDAKLKLYTDIHYAFPEGESTFSAQKRAIKVLRSILNEYKGKKIVIGTHGDIMTLMLNDFDKRFDFSFWASTAMPDIYKIEFQELIFVKADRLWR